MTRGRSKLWAAVAVLAFVGAACGDDDDDDAAAPDTTAPSTGRGATTGATEPGPATSGPATTGGAATTAGPASTAPSTGEPPTGEPIRIGVLTSLTGNFAPWGVQVRDGMQLGVDEINAAGGVDGRPLEL